MRRMILVAIAAALVAATTVAASGRDHAQAVGSTSGVNAVEHWSGVAQNAISAGRSPASSEVLNGLVHAAIYDAVVAIEGEYEPFAVSMRRSGPTSLDAAVAAAARGVLVIRVPGQAPTVESEYTAFLAGIPEGARKTNGIRLGRAVAGAYLGLRSDDGFDNVVPWIQPPTGAGVFEPIPAGSTPVDVKLKQVRPLTFDDPARFRPNGPDSLTSSDYTSDFNDVRDLGRVDSAIRTPEQTQIALFWSEQTMVHGPALSGVSRSTGGLNELKTARMMAMAHCLCRRHLVGVLGGQVLLQLLAPAACDPACRLGREPRHRPGHDLDASAQRQPPGVPLGALLLHLGDHPCVGGVLRYRQGPALDHEHRDRDRPATSAGFAT